MRQYKQGDAKVVSWQEVGQACNPGSLVLASALPSGPHPVNTEALLQILPRLAGENGKVTDS